MLLLIFLACLDAPRDERYMLGYGHGCEYALDGFDAVPTYPDSSYQQGFEDGFDDCTELEDTHV